MTRDERSRTIADIEAKIDVVNAMVEPLKVLLEELYDLRTNVRCVVFPGDVVEVLTNELHFLGTVVSIEGTKVSVRNNADGKVYFDISQEDVNCT